MAKDGCPGTHGVQTPRWYDGECQQEFSDLFPITNRVKPRSVVFSAMLQDSCWNNSSGIYIIYRFDGGLLNLEGCRPKTKWRKSQLVSCCLQMTVLWLTAQMWNYNSVGTISLGRTISIKKTEDLCQPVHPCEQPKTLTYSVSRCAHR